MRSLNLNVGGIDLVALIGSHDGEDMVAVRPICEVLGLDWKTQHRKLVKNDLLRCGHMTIPSDGGPQKTLCIPIKKVAAWLFSINSNKVKEEYKAAVMAFQDELQHVLYSYVKGDLTFEMMEELKNIVAILIRENAELKERVANLEMGTEAVVTHYASASAHGMLAAKARKRHLQVARI